MGSFFRTRWFIGSALIVWLCVVGLGFIVLMRFGATPGAIGDIPTSWPSSSRMIPDPDRATLLMFAHPRCPCTRASLAELEKVMAQCQGLVTAHVLFFIPDRADRAWLNTDVRQMASAIPGVHVSDDLNALEARRFGGVTSGQVVLYRSNGRLLFSGGITAARGHQGDNPGETDLVALIHGERNSRGEFLVFGCPLLDPKVCRER